MAPLVQQMVRIGLEALDTQEELAGLSGVDVGAIRRAQGGDLEGWDVAMVARLARTVGVDPAVALSASALPVPNLLAFLRKASTVVSPRDSLAIRRSLSRASALRAAGLQPRLPYKPKKAPGTKAYEAGYKAARRVRKDIGNEAEPLTDLRGIIEGEFGILVTGTRLETLSLEALAIADEHGAAIILNIHPKRSPEIWRRSIAHELCHLLFDPREPSVLIDILPNEDPASRTPAAQVENREQRARAFAAELLVPKRAILQRWPDSLVELGKAQSAAQSLCEEFGAPWELVVHHLMNHNRITEQLRDQLLKDRPTLSSKRRVGRSAALQWAKRQVEDGELSEGRAREIFGSAWPDGDELSA